MISATAVLHSRLDLGHELVGVSDARRHARDVLGEWGMPEEVLDDALSIVTELVANAIRHAETGESRPRHSPLSSVLELRVVVGHLYVVVHDASRRAPILRPLSEDAENGRGLLLVAALTEGAWGFVYATHGAGKLVWARLSLPRAATDGVAPDSVPAADQADQLPRSVVAVGAGT
ncbi:ATP-binding protein [Streptomyces sp. NPDC003300]|uniref:ATP-binding protein n=1 Tax=unclassified Streptomyces TaxID=2593676 RepID=UPI0033BCAEA0